MGLKRDACPEELILKACDVAKDAAGIEKQGLSSSRFEANPSGSQGLHIIWLQIDFVGHVNPTLPVVKHLTSMGCEVTYFVGESMRDVVEGAGATWRPFRYADSSSTGYTCSLDAAGIESFVPEGTPAGDYAGLPNGLAYGAYRALPLLLEDLRTMDAKPSVVVYEPFIAAGPIVAQMLGIKAVTVFTMPGPGTIAKPTAVTDKVEGLPWIAGPRDKIQQAYGFDIFEHSLNLEFYSDTANIVSTVDDIFMPPSSERQLQRFGHFPFTCVGSLIDPDLKRMRGNVVAQRAARAKSPKSPKSPVRFHIGRSASFFDEIIPKDKIEAAKSAARKVVFISLGTVATNFRWSMPWGPAVNGNDEAPPGQRPLGQLTGKEICQFVWRCCFEALGDDDNFFVLLVVGVQPDALEGMPPPPSNFVIRETVNQLDLLQYCDVMVTHGGSNSMHEALSYGVPLVFVPIFGDQPLNAGAVAKTGAGVSFQHPLRSLSASALHEAMADICEDEDTNRYQAMACSMASKLQKAGGAGRAAQIIMSHARRRRTWKDMFACIGRICG